MRFSTTLSLGLIALSSVSCRNPPPGNVSTGSVIDPISGISLDQCKEATSPLSAFSVAYFTTLVTSYESTWGADEIADGVRNLFKSNCEVLQCQTDFTNNLRRSNCVMNSHALLSEEARSIEVNPLGNNLTSDMSLSEMQITGVQSLAPGFNINTVGAKVPTQFEEADGDDSWMDGSTGSWAWYGSNCLWMASTGYTNSCNQLSGNWAQNADGSLYNVPSGSWSPSDLSYRSNNYYRDFVTSFSMYRQGTFCGSCWGNVAAKTSVFILGVLMASNYNGAVFANLSIMAILNCTPPAPSFQVYPESGGCNGGYSRYPVDQMIASGVFATTDEMFALYPLKGGPAPAENWLTSTHSANWAHINYVQESDVLDVGVGGSSASGYAWLTPNGLSTNSAGVVCGKGTRAANPVYRCTNSATSHDGTGTNCVGNEGVAGCFWYLIKMSGRGTFPCTASMLMSKVYFNFQSLSYLWISYSSLALVPSTVISSTATLTAGGSLEAAFMWTLKKGPMSNSITSTDPDFHSYSTGIYDGTVGTVYYCTGKEAVTNHAIHVWDVVYNTTNEMQYYWIQNSWGSTWGIGGYARIGFTSQNTNRNTCGVRKDFLGVNINYSSNVFCKARGATGLNTYVGTTVYCTNGNNPGGLQSYTQNQCLVTMNGVNFAVVTQCGVTWGNCNILAGGSYSYLCVPNTDRNNNVVFSYMH